MNELLQPTDVLAMRVRQLVNYCTFVVRVDPYVNPIRTGIMLDVPVEVNDGQGKEYRISEGTYFNVDKILCAFIDKGDDIYRLFPTSELVLKGMTRQYIHQSLNFALRNIVTNKYAGTRINAVLSWLNSNYSSTLLWINKKTDSVLFRTPTTIPSAFDKLTVKSISPKISQTRFVVRGGYNYRQEFMDALNIVFSDRKNKEKAISHYLRMKSTDADFSALDIIVDNYDILHKNLMRTYKFLASKGTPCPHYTELVKVLSSLKPVREGGGYDVDQVKKYIASNWGDRDGEVDIEDSRFYCKNCGALIYVALTEGLALSSQLQSSNEETDPTWTLVHRNIRQTMKFIRLSSQDLVDDIAEMIQPTIDTVLTQLNRIKTMSMKDIRLLKILQANIYIYAALARLAFVKKLDWKLKIKGTEKMKPEMKSKVSAYSLFMTNFGNSQVIISRQDIQSLFNKAYDAFAQLPFETIKERQPIKEEEPDRFFDFARIAYRAAGESIPKLATSLKPLTSKSALALSIVQEYNAYFEFREKKIFAYSANDPESIEWFKKWNYLAKKVQTIKTPALTKSFELMEKRIAKDIPHVELFCPDGRKHDFTTAGVKYLVGANDKAISAKELPPTTWKPGKMKMVCGHCGYIPGSSTGKFDEAALDAVARFFSFVKTYCPVKNEHEYAFDKDGLVGSNPCLWCQYAHKQDMIYYKKWRKTIEIIINNEAEVIRPHARNTRSRFIPAAIDVGIIPGFIKGKWQLSTAPIMEASRILNISSNLFLMIGAMEKEIYSNIEKNIVTPDKIKDKPHQLDVLVNYVRGIQILFAQIETGHLPDGLSIKGKINTNQPFPNIEEYVRLENFKNIDAAINYAQCALASVILQNRELSKYLLKKILDEEKLYTSVQLSKVAAIESKIYEGIADEDDEAEDESEPVHDELSLDDVDVEHSNTGAEDEYNEDE